MISADDGCTAFETKILVKKILIEKIPLGTEVTTSVPECHVNGM
jgi:hypothetical protein